MLIKVINQDQVNMMQHLLEKINQLIRKHIILLIKHIHIALVVSRKLSTIRIQDLELMILRTFLSYTAVHSQKQYLAHKKEIQLQDFTTKMLNQSNKNLDQEPMTTIKV